MEQLDFWAPIASLEPIANETIQQRFSRFHSANPHVYAALVNIARRMMKAGCSRIGIKQLYEIMRWERLLYAQANVGDDRKLNNDYTAYYAREIMAKEADLTDAFEIRRLRAA